LAAYPEEKVKEIFRKSDMTKRTPYTITNYADLILDLERTRQRGYAIDNREGEIEVFCVAAPIYNQFSQPIAAISIASLYSKINDERLHKFERLITETALGISKRLGFTGERLF
jgi:DNA-binding IclR family transcriptional regulator